MHDICVNRKYYKIAPLNPSPKAHPPRGDFRMLFKKVLPAGILKFGTTPFIPSKQGCSGFLEWTICGK